MQDIDTKQLFSYIIKIAGAFKLPIAVMFFTAIVWSIDLSLKPYLLKLILNGVAEFPAEEIFSYIAIPVMAYFAMTFLMSTTFRLYDYFVSIKMIPRMRQKITDDAFSKLLEQSHHYYQNNFSGSLTNKVSDLSSNVPEIIQIIVDRFFAHFLALAVAVFTLWQVSAKFALIVLVWTALFVLASMLLAKKLQRLSANWSELASTITGKLVDALSNILSIRLFARKKQEREFLDKTLTETVQAERKLQWTYFWIWVGYGYSFVLVQGIVLYLLITGRQEGVISVGDFALVLGINIGIVDSLWEFTKIIAEFTKSIGKSAQALVTITAPIEIQDAKDAIDLKVQNGEIIFDKVQFTYSGDEPLFENKSIIISPGQKVGLVGYSGSGKSTFVNLILRLFDLNSGQILIDNQNIAQITQDSLHEAIGMIPQDPSLFHRTLLENIRYGLANASFEEVIKAAKRAHAHEFIETLPLGYESLVGERGIKLSGGQRQRIAIARAMLKNAPILILDEATSQLDSITEKYIQESLWDLMQGKTTLIIAHRLSTLLHMDRILVFERGKIVQDGTHKSLLEEQGLYKTLWDAQVGGFILDE